MRNSRPWRTRSTSASGAASPRAVRTATVGQLEGPVGRVARADPAAVAQRIGDRPPDVGLAVGHAAALEDEGVVLARRAVAASSSARRDLPTPGLAQHEQQAGPAVAHGVVHAVAEQAQLGLAADQRGAVALGAVARAEASRRRPARPATSSSRPFASSGSRAS